MSAHWSILRSYAALLLLVAATALPSVVGYFSEDDGALLWNVSRALLDERTRAEELWQAGTGLLWFQHFRRAGGTSLCQLLRLAVPRARLPPQTEACQPEEWKLRDALAVCENNISLLAVELDILGGNAFAQEYGPVPGPELLRRRSQSNARLRDVVFVTTIRDPWSRFWSQLRYELAPCLAHPGLLARCIGGDFEDIGIWYSPTAHIDSVLGVPGARIAPRPALYIDNYYTRVLIDKTDVSRKLTWDDYIRAMTVLRDRFSAVIVLEDFARSALQLTCVLGLDIERARTLLRTRVRPYEASERLMAVPGEESALGDENMRSLRYSFVKRNKFDYALYAFARRLSKRRLFACATRKSLVRQIWRAPAEEFADVVSEPMVEPPKEGDPLPQELSVDDLFGCHGGRVEFNESSGVYMLYCPRSPKQHAASWWKSETTDGVQQPQRKKGQRSANADCWHEPFTWSACCGPRFGPTGNSDCWGEGFNYRRCCITG